MERASALLEVFLCSGFPTQLVIASVMATIGCAPLDPDGRLSIVYVFSLAIADTFVLTGLVFVLLYAHRESPREVFLDNRPQGGEVLRGFLLIPAVFGIVVVAMVTMQKIAPWLHNISRNPLEDLLRLRTHAGMFAFVAIVSGGVREEIQRAFILHRFEQYLGGAWVGLIVFSVVFGAGHIIQGWDVAIVTGLLGAFWGYVYLRRRSIIAPVVSHAGFNTTEIVRYALLVQ